MRNFRRAALILLPKWAFALVWRPGAEETQGVGGGVEARRRWALERLRCGQGGVLCASCREGFGGRLTPLCTYNAFGGCTRAVAG